MKAQRTWRVVVCMFLFALMATAVFAIDVKTDYDRAANFSNNDKLQVMPPLRGSSYFCVLPNPYGIGLGLCRAYGAESREPLNCSG